jgi:hypothetical protein
MSLTHHTKPEYAKTVKKRFLITFLIISPLITCRFSDKLPVARIASSKSRRLEGGDVVSAKSKLKSALDAIDYAERSLNRAK